MRFTPLVVALAFLAGPVVGLEPGPNDLYARVVDVGPGLCVVVVTPDDHALVYDAGHWNGGKCIEAVRELVDGPDIDYLILSHSDSDHLGDAAAILNAYDVGTIIHTGNQRTTGTWKDFNRAAKRERTAGATLRSLASNAFTPGETLPLGAATIVLVAGWNRFPGASELSTSERMNVVSIVARVVYRGHSILLAGDSVGRHINDADDTCAFAEKIMVSRADDVPLDSDVLLAPHHGADNGSSTCFIEAVAPSFVIFSAGHDFNHPRASAVGRYMAADIDAPTFFRTDRGDDEGGTEWMQGSVSGCTDDRGDDDIDVVLPFNSAVKVAYRRALTGC